MRWFAWPDPRQCRATFQVTTLLLIAIAMQTAANAEEDAKPDTVAVHGKPLTLSCAEWKRNQDGSWISTGPLLVGTETVNSVTLRGAKDTNVLEAKCGSGAPPAAKPARTEEPNKHAGHRHHSAEPSDGT
jgi:hypothetical protein